MKCSFSWWSKVFGSGYGWSRDAALGQRHCRRGRRAKVCRVCSFPPGFHLHARPPLALRTGWCLAQSGWAAAEWGRSCWLWPSVAPERTSCHIPRRSPSESQVLPFAYRKEHLTLCGHNVHLCCEKCPEDRKQRRSSVFKLKKKKKKVAWSIGVWGFDR